LLSLFKLRGAKNKIQSQFMKFIVHYCDRYAHSSIKKTKTGLKIA